ncbi:MAG: ABC transporter permease [Candidatus Rokubacteria bacterium]|nr:ABC transporter permease [Candidatus Rokubacteria bacterium]
MPSGFPLRLAWRETRGAWRHFTVFFACVALGVASLVAVGTLAVNLDRTIRREAKTLMGGDLELRSALPLAPEALAALGRLRADGATTTAVRELVGMARHPGRGATLLVELKAVAPAYPLYGRVETRPGAALAALLADRGATAGAVVAPGLLERLGLAVGDAFEVGAARLVITGVLEREPDRAGSVVTLGPRVLIADAALERTGLVQVGSRVRYRTLVRMPPDVPARTAEEALARAALDPGVRVTAFDEAQPGLRRFFTQLASYLGLVGLASLLVGGIGVAASVTTFVRRQLPTIAVLKCLGAGPRTLVAAYALQMQALGVLASLAGAAAGVLIQPLLIHALAPIAPVPLAVELDPWTLVRGVALGSLTALLCALWPLLEVRAVPPSLILRRDVETARSPPASPRSRSGRPGRGRSAPSSWAPAPPRSRCSPCWPGASRGWPAPCRAGAGSRGATGSPASTGRAATPRASSRRSASGSCCSSPSRCSREASGASSRSSRRRRRHRSSSWTSRPTSASPSPGSWPARRAGRRPRSRPSCARGSRRSTARR